MASLEHRDYFDQIDQSFQTIPQVNLTKVVLQILSCLLLVHGIDRSKKE